MVLDLVSRDGRLHMATLVEEHMPYPRFVSLVRHLLALSPLELSEEAQAKISSYSLRRLLPTVADGLALVPEERAALGNWRDNFKTSAFDQASLTGTGGFAHSFANQDVISLSGQVQKFWLGHAGYRTAYGVIGQYTHRLSGGRALSFSAQWNRFDYDTDPLKDSNRYTLGVGYVAKTWSLSAMGGHEETRHVAGDANSNTFFGLSGGAEVPVMKHVALTGGAALQYAKYDAPDPLFLVAREETRLDISAGLKIAVLPNLYVQPKATYTRNWSNIPLYDHDRWTASAGLRLEF